MPYRLITDKRVVGTKQVKRVLMNNEAKIVYLAKDVDDRIKEEIIGLCSERQVPIVDVDTMGKLGKACKLEVGAATAALLKNKYK